MTKESPSLEYTLFVSGMHCAACTVLIGDELTEAGMSRVRLSLSDGTVTFSHEGGESAGTLMKRLNLLLAPHGYELHTTMPARVSTRGEWLPALLGAGAVFVGFLLLEQANLISFIRTSTVTFGSAFFIGVIASLSTCLAVVGAMVLSVSATYAHLGGGWRPQALFHIGRFASFFLLGGLLGLLGETIRLGVFGSSLLSAAVSIVMLFLGIQLLDVTQKVRALTLPKEIMNRLVKATSATGALAPLLLGGVTFFLPCGFTQSMQAIALSTQSFSAAALTMTAFALGTFPMLALLSFGTQNFGSHRYRGAFFKAAGLLVIAFAVFNLYHVLTLLVRIT